MAQESSESLETTLEESAVLREGTAIVSGDSLKRTEKEFSNLLQGTDKNESGQELISTAQESGDSLQGAANENTKAQEKKSNESADLLQQIMGAGKDMFQTQTMDIDPNVSVMFPPYPSSSFIDRFPSEKQSKAEQTASNQQVQYEEEVKVFKALERLGGPNIALHSFKYTHQQYNLFVDDHRCKKKDQEEEGEADFVVIHDKFIAVIEVKAPEFGKKNERTVFERNYKKSKQQREKTCELIRAICRKNTSPEPELRQYTIFTNIDRESADKISKYTCLGETEKQSILFRDDVFEDVDNLCNSECSKMGIYGISPRFHQYFDYKIIDATHEINIDPGVKAQVVWTILGIWCANEKNQFSKDKWDLGRTINHIDDFLRDAHISNKPEAPTSSRVKGSPAVFKYLGIKCLTVEQKEVFYDERPRLVINGPAGSGKTMLVIGKIIQLVTKSKANCNGIIVVVANGLIALEYETQLNKAGISSTHYRGEPPSTFRDETEVAIVHVDYSYLKDVGRADHIPGCTIQDLGEILDLTNDCHIFLDDFHAFTFAMDNDNPYVRSAVDKLTDR